MAQVIYYDETEVMNEMDVMDETESLHTVSDAHLLECYQHDVGIIDNSDVHEVALSRMSTMTLEDSPAEITDDISEFVENGCGCSKWNGKSCVKQFSVSHIQEIRLQCQELSRSEFTGHIYS